MAILFTTTVVAIVKQIGSSPGFAGEAVEI
jgi:hypothetical protein